MYRKLYSKESIQLCIDDIVNAFNASWTESTMVSSFQFSLLVSRESDSAVGFCEAPCFVCAVITYKEHVVPDNYILKLLLQNTVRCAFFLCTSVLNTHGTVACRGR